MTPVNIDAGWIGSRLAKSASLTIAVISVIAILALTGVVVGAARRIDLDTRHHGETLVANGLAIKVASVRACIFPNSVWDEAVRNLDNHFNQAWADSNVGQFMANTCGLKETYVFDWRDQVLGSWRNAVPGKPEIGQPARATIAGLVADVRRREAMLGPYLAPAIKGQMNFKTVERSVFGMTSEGPILASATLIRPDLGTSVPLHSRSAIVVGVMPLDRAFLDWFAKHYLLQDLKLDAPPFDNRLSQKGSADIRDPSGRTISRLVWQYGRPVQNLALSVAPPLMLLILVLVVAPALVIRRDRRQVAMLREAMVRAEAASEAKGQFLAVVSHEIRTPLNGVLGMAQVMEHDPLPKVQRDRLKVIIESGEALLNILNDILDLSKIEADKLELEITDFELADVVASAVASVRSTLERKGLVFELDCPDEINGVYRGDPLRIGQVLSNLLSNAVKFTDNGSVSLRLGYNGTTMSFQVCDTGLGIEPENLNHLFEKFVQADSTITRRFGGTGLGLAICRQLTTAMDGDITVESRPGQGSAFTVTLPLPRIPRSEDDSVQKTNTAPVANRELRILVAEDNGVNQLVLRTLLEQAGLVPVVVADGVAALEAWEADHWDLILMDVQMPVMDGVTAAQEIRRRERETERGSTPILALTANAMTHQIEAYIAAGMDGVVAKPIEVANLFESIEAVLADSDRAPTA
ncbi:MAG: hypothetical protein CGW95_13235 [Phenylobacterium zucineum]|nr:MAG: hypothetical protein CGW95_13235 [Phenylobacterium zucineum]